MKVLRRNMTKFEYIGYTGEETDIDPETGLHTGEARAEEKEPVAYRGSISAEKYLANQKYYGEEARYTHTIIMDNPDADIREDGVIRWRGEEYEIRAVHRSINVLSVQIRKKTKNHAREAEEPEGEGEGGTEADTWDGTGEGTDEP